MKPTDFDYVRPTDLGSAIAALAGNPNAKAIAGGQSLGPMLNLRLARPTVLVDIGRLAELQFVEDGGSFWRLGAGLTHAQIEDGATPLRSAGFLPTVARGIAYRAIRNRGTIGGSLAHADPAADWPLVLAALGASLLIRGAQGERRIAVDRFMVSAFTTALTVDELIVAVDIPKPSGKARFGHYKFCRKLGEFPMASAAIALDPDHQTSRVFLGALGGPPRPLPIIGEALARGEAALLSAGLLAEAVSGGAPSLDPIDRRLFAGCLSRAIEKATQS